jgi:tetratricopeptide (TPR) repeat protein
MRIPSRVREGLPHFESALDVAKGLLPSANRNKLIAEAHKEHGYYYRNIGEWEGADRSYKRARDVIMETILEVTSAAELDEIASIQTNWAYVKGLVGNYSEGTHLAEAAVAVRRQFGGAAEEGISLSVCGEVYRYARRFEKAWAAYANAERLLQGRPNWNWLGLIYQEQAICLHQALQDDISLTADPMGDAKRLITNALDICLSHSIRGYPSALNRAGRIYGHDDPDQGLSYLEKGITEARRLSDGRFLLANLVEYAELNYRTWESTGNNQYRTNITTREAEISSVVREYGFPDLAGRWTLLQGHLAISDHLYSGSGSALVGALEHYKRGFSVIAKQPIASPSAAVITGEFEKFERLFRQLPPSVRADWQTKLTTAWQSSDEGSTLLLARLQELLARLQDPY